MTNPGEGGLCGSVGRRPRLAGACRAPCAHGLLRSRRHQPGTNNGLVLGLCEQGDETDQEEIEDATDVMPLRRGTDSEKYENGTSKEGQKRDAGQVQVQRRREGRHAIENVSCCHRMSRPEATTVNIF